MYLKNKIKTFTCMNQPVIVVNETVVYTFNEINDHAHLIQTYSSKMPIFGIRLTYQHVHVQNQNHMMINWISIAHE